MLAKLENLLKDIRRKTLQGFDLERQIESVMAAELRYDKRLRADDAWSWPFATCTGGIHSSINWRKYSTCTGATCTVWWCLYVVFVDMRL